MGSLKRSSQSLSTQFLLDEIATRIPSAKALNKDEENRTPKSEKLQHWVNAYDTNKDQETKTPES